MQYVLVTVDSGKPVMFAGTEEPAAFGELFSIGAIGGDKNKQVMWKPSFAHSMSHVSQSPSCLTGSAAAV